MRFITLFIAVSLWLSANVQAQVVSDTLKMKEITVTSTRYRIPVIKQPSHTVLIDSVQLANTNGQSLGEALSRYSSIFVRSNAPGAVSLASFRGFGGEQTRVLWEGMPINHSMLGVLDLSLIRSGAFSSVEVSSGSGSSTYGSGISGSVSLASSINSGEFTAGQSIGSNSNYITFGNIGFETGNWTLGLGGSIQENENDYRYYDRNTEQEENRRHATFDNDQFQLQAGWNREGKRFQSKFWYLKSDHEILENVFVGSGTSRQYDSAYRWVNSFHFRRGNVQHGIKSYLAQTDLDYFDPNRNIESISTGREWNNEWTATAYFSPVVSLTNITSAYFTEVKTNNYTEKKYRKLLSEQLMAEISPTKALGIFPTIRVDHYSDFGAAVSPSLGINYQIIEDEIYFHSLVSRNFRAPTFNDLYWPQGGNEDLKPETAILTEAGIGITDQWKNIGDHNLTFFRMDISNGIKWNPGGGTFFRAQNYLSLLSYGVEWTAFKEFEVGTYKLSYSQSSSYTRSTIDEARFEGDAAVGDQLPYVPKWKYSGSFSVSRGEFRTSLYGNWVSERYSTEQNDIRDPEPSYFVLDASINYSKTIRKTQLDLSMQVNNILDEQYEVVRLYPQPLRNFLITLTIKHKNDN
ncbi:TonB-dependent receptor [bacterium]|nr:TonB-dependent receptor [bacterium]